MLSLQWKGLATSFLKKEEKLKFSFTFLEPSVQMIHGRPSDLWVPNTSTNMQCLLSQMNTYKGYFNFLNYGLTHSVSESCILIPIMSEFSIYILCHWLILCREHSPNPQKDWDIAAMSIAMPNFRCLVTQWNPETLSLVPRLCIRYIRGERLLRMGSTNAQHARQGAS